MSDKQSRIEEISRTYGDPWIWGIYLTLIIFSIVEGYSASSREIATQGVYGPLFKQVFFLGIGAVGAFGLSRINYNNKIVMLIMIPLLWIFTVCSLAYVQVAGEIINGARRAFTIPGIDLTVQPAELAKLSVVTALAYVLARTQRKKDISNGGIALLLAITAVFGGLMFTSGLTNTLLLGAISYSMLLIGGVKWKKFGLVVGVTVLLGASYIYIGKMNDRKVANLAANNPELLESNNTKQEVDRSQMREDRIENWKHRDSLVYKPITPYNQQEMFSCMAQAHGGWIGKGIGNSRECSRLPLAFSDYIFSIIIEEIGIIGGIFIMTLYLWLLARAAMIARRCHRVLPALLIIGMAAMITFQALFHMAINTGVFPVSGQPLPLISKGGTSILVVSVAFGVMLSVSRTVANYRYSKTAKEAESADIALPESLSAANPTEMLPKNEWK